ncbi:hypothetical protein EKH80_13690 [Dyella choica]|uniref:Uncharacterized protein n=2 Tax=Dyella choica TaxID=1927959 RepID=A0A3S0PI04_9GAMM|nr:hypothetical protein EKH80_13690 [Dyella choica]
MNLFAADATPFEPGQAKAWFDEAHRQCSIDHGRLWGASLCGPMMFVDPSTRRIIASQADAQGRLKPEQDVFIGRLPDEVSMSNSSLEWAGVSWAQMLWPMPADAGERRIIMAHESFHRIQPRIGLAPPPLAPPPGGGNDHLDALQGRYLMQLEWRALDQALAATDEKARRGHIEDALLFRAARHQQFPNAAATERALERNEGLAEYTGVTVGALSPVERVALARKDLAVREQTPSFVRSFAYATGPAYGLLLDRYLPTWRLQIRANDIGLSELLATALSYHPVTASEEEIQTRATAYHGAALLASEQLREQRHQKQVASYKAILIDGPLLVLPLHDPHVMFNPSTLVSMGDAGTVYPTMKVISDWGTIEVRDAALMSPDWKRLAVAAPTDASAHAGIVEGQGWTLKLKAGWQIAGGTRKGDLIVRKTDGDWEAPGSH